MAIMPDIYSLIAGLGTPQATGLTVPAGMVMPTPEQQAASVANLGQNLPLVPQTQPIPAPLPAPAPATAPSPVGVAPQLPPEQLAGPTTAPQPSVVADPTLAVAQNPSWIQGITGVGLTGQDLTNWQNMAALGSLMTMLGAGIGGTDTVGGRMGGAANQFIQGAISGQNALQAQNAMMNTMKAGAQATSSPASQAPGATPQQGNQQSGTQPSGSQPKKTSYQSPDTSKRGKPEAITQTTAMVSPYDDWIRRMTVTGLA